jgi:ketosteroid isomerase-like protein
MAPDFAGVGLVGAFAERPVTYTDEEQRNIETALALRRASFEQRRTFHGPGFTVHRRGMAHLAEAGGGYNSESIADRVDEVLDIIAKNDRVWCVWRICGTHTGDLFGIPATGRRIEVLEMGAWRFADGKVVEAWFFADEYALARALDLQPAAS